MRYLRRERVRAKWGVQSNCEVHCKSDGTYCATNGVADPSFIPIRRDRFEFSFCELKLKLFKRLRFCPRFIPMYFSDVSSSVSSVFAEARKVMLS